MATKVISPSASQLKVRPRIRTKFFGELDYDAGSVFQFPSGIPGFEDHKDFLFINLPESAPLLFLQSITCRTLCFVLLPIFVIDPGYQLVIPPEDLIELHFPPDQTPRIGHDILCGAIISAVPGEEPTANLMAPLVVNLCTKTGKQVIRSESGYSHRQPLQILDHSLIC